ncbi:MAG: hypothetical protein QM619_02730 [Micropruina sp.]|uniref:esterase/lipase family protein n=1 Tax=Micropruina sp. TaxID=2737536 RepID=UPI0039E437C4
MATLDGSSRQVNLGRGIAMRTPGLRGRAEAHDVTAGGDTRAPEVDGSGAAFDAAFTQEGFLRLRVITLDVAPLPQAPSGDLRAPVSDVPGMEVTVPDLGDDVAQVLLAVDENGVVSWNFPVDSGDALAPTTRGSGDVVRFIVPAFATPDDSPDAAATRGVFGLIGRKVLELVALPLAELVVPPLAGAAARLWESKSRIARARSFTPANYTSADVPSLADADWRRLASGPSLWFVHGTFVNTHTAFQAFPPDLLAALSDHYGGRVAAIDHHTLGVDPIGNADLVRELVPDGVQIQADIVCHSRGGLVSRALAGQGGDPVFDVRKIVHVASANHGTALATPSNLVPFIDRVTTMVNLMPDGAAAVVEATLTSVLVVVKIIAKYGLTGIPGLAAMDSDGDFLSGFNATELPADQFAIAADFTPSGGWRAMALKNVQNVVVDRVFGSAANDLVVPTAGVYEGDDAMRVRDDRRLVLPKARGVYHGSFFGQRDVATQVASWLTG